MDDLIKRQDAIDSIEKLLSARYGWKTDARDEIQGLNAALCAIIELQPAQKKGHWIHCKYPLGECSVCHKIINIQANEAIYCPCCGSWNTWYEEYE